ncbi:LacI family DNA-binding transcriptional regulator [Cocleimonas sp. KMM 6892]|uniref:LacI family DNA-binding transcriptional regulator n=1 Tax=unclassified Cocleimonas TaxID=2639732 RepID=UPI002DB97040|nr:MULTISPECIES: LacI family DNA-binding transcriptional regulator [unclassified Cocleimonas]MEB8433518.1 LacI family DNA-binding transcriptional regulator [Cocleimonas sp. KMM 6892]MEC4716329.1 LacI family DNA-binding transcriptional regulator [Cocleimonas sp. KMM 6895]MEC4745778.1 LacI family DNA-binding transcriptional regulator [Cocleimonas sp. KMM 6896]
MQKKKPTLQDVAAKANVSTATVSRCLNAPDKVRTEVQQKINQAIDELGYVPDGAARALASRRTNTVGVIVPTIDNSIFSKALQYLQTGLNKANYTLLLTNNSFSEEIELREVQTLLSRGIDGIVMVGAQHHPEIYKAINRYQIPIVNLWIYDPDSEYSCIGFDHIKAGKQITKHLLELGHESFGVISGTRENNDRAEERFKGLKQQLDEAGIILEDDRVIDCRFSVENGSKSFHKLLDRHPDITAIICGNDVLAIGALHGAQERGIRVPEDLSITGFDNIEILPFLKPSLTTINSPSRRMGEKAADYILQQIKDKTNIIERIELEAELIVRETTGPAPKR